MGAGVTIIAQPLDHPRSRQEVAQAAATGSGTVTRSIRVTKPGKDASVTAMLEEPSSPPAWLPKLLQEDFPERDEHNIIGPSALIRFAQACAALPLQTPQPFFNVGDDATLGAEWDIGLCHIAIQVGNDPAVDALYVEVNDREIGEIPLNGNERVPASIMAQILAG